MKKYVLVSGFSLALGAALASVALDRDPQPRAAAQPAPRPVAQAPAPAVPASPAPAPASAQPLRLTAEERVNISVYEGANRSVVNINTRSFRQDSFFMVEIPSEGAGSGSVLDRKGHVLTNFHVVDGARQIEVTLWNGKTHPAEMIGMDAINDVAVLKINAPAEELFPVPLGDSAELLVGQKVYALGNPFGLERTLTTGIVSSLNRTLPARNTQRTMKSIIQVDAAMNPGNSGGPLLDTAGRMIGMNTAIASRTGQNTGVGFAIPVNRIKRIVPELIRNGQVTRPGIGISRVMQTDQGLLVAVVVPGGPADRAGLQGFRVVRRQHRQGPFVYESQTIDRSTADLITGIDGKPVRTFDELLSAVEEKNPGDQVELTIQREGRTMRVPVRLGEDDS